jgi:transcriptional regulator with GAF, ATPase, and Fis domain
MSRSIIREQEVTLVKYANPLHRAATDVELSRLHVTVERVAGAERSETHVLEGEVCRIGSHPSNDVVLDDPTISRFHCRVSRAGAAWRIEDAGSTNGTRINAIKVNSAELEGEVRVAIGDSILRIEPRIRGRVSVPELRASFGAIVGASAVMQRLYGVLERVAASDIDVLIQGESGTGKELVATELVSRSARADGPVVVVDCGAISPSLIESELFGHVRGAFTGADRDREGAFEAAHGGTLFLDEIGELPLELQPKLLRALEAREVRRVGQTRARRVDVRVFAATNRDLEREINRGRFREDLYYRLEKVSVRLPPLRDRLEDVALIVRSFLASMDVTNAERLFSADVIAEMQRHEWPGNVRELKNYVERCVVLDGIAPPSRRSGTMPAQKRPDEADVSLTTPPPPAIDHDIPFRVAKDAAVSVFERAYLGSLLERCQGNVSKAARIAKMDRMYLHQLARKYGISTARRP